jgi:hypothetical protein
MVEVVISVMVVIPIIPSISPVFSMTNL